MRNILEIALPLQTTKILSDPTAHVRYGYTSKT